MVRVGQAAALKELPSAAGQEPRAAAASRAPVAASVLTFELYTDLAAAESLWRAFEADAESTPFQFFDWLSAWHRHIGTVQGTQPVIVVARLDSGAVAMLLPFAVEQRGATRSLRWLGQDLCDYNAPMLVRDFSQRVTGAAFRDFWNALLGELRCDPALRIDWIDFEKMPGTVGVQSNPFIHLGLTPNANSAHIAQLGGDWETYYRERRSSATRRRDRAKRKRLAEFGEIRFVTASDPAEIRQTLGVLMQQKSRSFARKGIPDIFARPGHRDFFLDVASGEATRRFAHVSRVEIGADYAATNFALIAGDCYYHILASYCDGPLMRYGPGALHLRDLLGYAIGRGLRRFDFTIGDEQYKLEWSDLRLALFDYSTGVTPRGWLACLGARGRLRIKRIIKQSPMLWKTAVWMRASFRSRARPPAVPDAD